MSNTHCDNCDKDALRSELVPFPFMGGTGLRHVVPCETAPSVRALKVMGAAAKRATNALSIVPSDLPEGQDTAIAVAVAPENMEDAIAAISPDHLLGVLWWVDEYLRRLNAAKKGLIAETHAAMEHGELPSMEIEVAGHRLRYQQASSNEYDDIPGLLYYLNRVGASVSDIGRAVGYLRVGVLQEIVAALPEDVRADAYATLEDHRVKKPGAFGLVDLDSPYRKGKR